MRLPNSLKLKRSLRRARIMGKKKVQRADPEKVDVDWRLAIGFDT